MPSRHRRTGSAVLLLFGAALAPGCGGDERPSGPPPPTGKVTPTLPRTWSGAGLDEWTSRAADADPAVRVRAAWGIAELAADPGAVHPVLRALVADPDVNVRWAALFAVRRVGGEDEALARAAVGQMASPESAALRAMGRGAATALGTSAVPALKEALASPEAYVRWGAVEALRGIGDPAGAAAAEVDRLVEADPDASVRTLSLEALPRLGEEGVRRAVARLEAADFTAQPVIARALAGGGVRALAALAGLLASPRDDVAAQAASALADLGPGAEGALPLLLQALSRGGSVRANAAEALAAIGEAAVPGLEKTAAGPDEAAAAAARYALERIRTDQR